MKLSILALAVCAAVGCAPPPAPPSTLNEHVDALTAHLDALIVRLDRLGGPAAPAASSSAPQHARCPAHDGHPEVDLGLPDVCPGKTADDGPCYKLPSGEWAPMSVAEARCKAGKL